jgi:hypothetical protein
MYDTVAYIFFTAVTVFLAAAVFFFRRRHRQALMSVAQLILDKEALLNRLEMATLENSKEANEGFIKFLSDSRQDAFDYIESVQKSVQNYLVAIESQNEDEIITARMELFSHLPEEAETEDKNKG